MIEAESFSVFLHEKKTLMEMDISIFTVLTSFYKIIQLSRSPSTSMKTGLYNIIFLFLTTINRDLPYWKRMELVNMPYCQADRTYVQIYKRKKAVC